MPDRMCVRCGRRIKTDGGMVKHLRVCGRTYRQTSDAHTRPLPASNTDKSRRSAPVRRFEKLLAMRALDDSDNTSDSCSTSSASIDASDAGSDGMASDDNAPDTVNHRTVERRNSATTETYPCAEDALFEEGHRDSVPLESPDADSTHGCLNDNEPLDDRPPNSPTHHTVDSGTEGTRISNWSTSVKSGYGILSATSMESLHRKEFVYDGGGVAGAPVGAVGADATT